MRETIKGLEILSLWPEKTEFSSRLAQTFDAQDKKKTLPKNLTSISVEFEKVKCKPESKEGVLGLSLSCLTVNIAKLLKG